MPKRRHKTTDVNLPLECESASDEGIVFSHPRSESWVTFHFDGRKVVVDSSCIDGLPCLMVDELDCLIDWLTARWNEIPTEEGA